MVKFVQILVVALFIVALCSAETPRLRTARIKSVRNRFLLARQVSAEPAAAVTPYPTADELKPEVPFDEAVPAEEQQPNQPDEVYGPPEDEGPFKTDAVAATGEEQSVADGESAIVEEVEQSVDGDAYVPARLTARPISARRSLARPAKLRKATSARLQLKPQFVPQPIFYYLSQ